MKKKILSLFLIIASVFTLVSSSTCMASNNSQNNETVLTKNGDVIKMLDSLSEKDIENFKKKVGLTNDVIKMLASLSEKDIENLKNNINLKTNNPSKIGSFFRGLWNFTCAAGTTGYNVANSVIDTVSNFASLAIKFGFVTVLYHFISDILHIV